MKSRRWLLGISMANVMFLYGPIAVLIVFSFNSSRLSATWTGATLHWYRELASDRALYAAVQNSLVVAGCSTIIAAMLGIAAAVGLESLPTTRRQAVEGAMLLPLVVPEVMLGVALMLFFVTIKVPLSLLTVTIGHARLSRCALVIHFRIERRKSVFRLRDGLLPRSARGPESPATHCIAAERSAGHFTLVGDCRNLSI